MNIEFTSRSILPATVITPVTGSMVKSPPAEDDNEYLVDDELPASASVDVTWRTTVPMGEFS
jgi:hypothetical protein